MPRSLHQTSKGTYYHGKAEDLLQERLGEELKGRVQLLLTSPPFPLNTKKSYGNLKGNEYQKWLSGLSGVFADLLTEDGSIVMELGNAWKPGRPVQSLLPLKSLLGFVDNPSGELRLCQEFVCYNPSRLPSPAQWVTIERIRVTDSYTHIWWMAKSDKPKADNSKVLRPYSNSMKALLKRQGYNAGKRPSGHDVSEESFLSNNGGSITPNLFEMEPMNPDRKVRLPNAFALANTNSTDFYSKTCRERGVDPHPARMPAGLAAFFVQFLTGPGDLVLDPFAGSNTTGFVSELFDRDWIAIDAMEEYAEQSKIRFEDPLLQDTTSA